jgi:hypothetical protein
MSDQIVIEQGILKLSLDRPLLDTTQAKDLRGVMAALFPDNVLFHHHGRGDSLLYRYPLVQYKIIDGLAMILGIGPGAYALTQINLLDTKIVLGKESYRVLAQELACTRNRVGLLEDFLGYRFLSPWLALNESNYQKYIRMGSKEKRLRFLAGVLIGNLISLSKGIDYTIPGKILVNPVRLKESPAMLKNTPMLGFTGMFTMNFEIPTYWGLGKSVARGYGALQQTNRGGGILDDNAGLASQGS